MTTITYQPSSGDDTYLNKTAQTTNFSTSINLHVGERDDLADDVNRALIKFDLSLIPRTARIIRAELTLKIDTERSSNARDQKIYRVLRNWVPSEATWSIYSTGNGWTGAGCTGAGTDYDTTMWATVNVGASESVGTLKVWSLTTTEFQKLIDGTYPNYGWVLAADTQVNDGILYCSSNHGTPANRPILEVEYSTGGISPMISPFGKL